MSEQSLGDKLKQLREQQGLTLDQLYSRTKILVNYIEALEEGRWDLLPGQAYLKPFVKNIAEALGADYEELSELIDQKTKTEVDEETEQKTRGFDYRWLAVLLMAGLVAVIIFIFNPLETEEQAPVVETPVAVEEPEPERDLLERQFSSEIDMKQDIFEDRQVYSVELTATDSVWVVLLSESDTLYEGILSAGEKVARESLEPLELFMARRNCLEITYNDVYLDPESILGDRRRIRFAEIDLEEAAAAGR